MAFSPKTDYCGLLAALNPASPAAAVIAIRDDATNESQSNYQPVGQNGEILDIEVYGHNAAPTNNYALLAEITATVGKIMLGKVVTVGTVADAKKYRLVSVKFSTAVNQPVKISASAQLVEASATDVATNNYDVPAFVLDTLHLAQDMFSAFTLTGNGANLVSCDAEAKLNVSTDTLVGDIISNGAGGAVLTVGGSILVKGDATPTVTPTQSSGFVVTKQPTCSNPETAYREFSFELMKPLARHTAVAAA